MGRTAAEILHLLLEAAWRRRFLVVVPLLMMPPIGALIGAFGSRTYESKTSLIVQEPAKINPFLADLSVGVHLAERIAALQSLVRSNELIGSAALEVGVLSHGSTKEERDTVISHLSKGLELQLIGTDLIDLRLRSKTPESLKELLHAIGSRFVDRLVAPERSSIAGSVEFLDRQITVRTADVERTEQLLAQFKTTNAAKLPEMRAGNIQRLGVLRQQLEERRVQLVGARAAATNLGAAIAATDPVVGHLEEEIVKLTGEMALLRSRYTDEHSAVQAVLRQLSRLEKERAAVIEAARSLSSDDLGRLWNLAASARQPGSQPPMLVSQLEQLQTAKSREIALFQEVAQLERATAELEAVVMSQSEVEQQLAGLERELRVKRDVLDKLMQRAEMARVTGDLGAFEAGQRVLVIQEPDEPSPVGPTPLKFALAGLIGGLALGVGLAVAMELGDDAVRRPSDLVRTAGLRVLARLSSGLAPTSHGRPGQSPPIANLAERA